MPALPISLDYSLLPIVLIAETTSWTKFLSLSLSFMCFKWEPRLRQWLHPIVTMECHLNYEKCEKHIFTCEPYFCTQFLTVLECLMDLFRVMTAINRVFSRIPLILMQTSFIIILNRSSYRNTVLYHFHPSNFSHVPPFPFKWPLLL